MAKIPPRFKGFVGQRRLREQSWEWSRLLLVCGAIAILWFWQAGQGPMTRGEVIFVDQAQQWLEQLSSGGVNPWHSLGALGQSPLTVVFIALGQSLGMESLWGDRLSVGILNLLSLPLLYGLGKTLYGTSLSALLAVVVYGTCFGVVYWGRLATSYGLLLPLTLIYLTSVLFCRRDLRGSLGLGLGLTALALTDLGAAVLLGASGLLFLHWDTPRLLRTHLFWIGVALGLLPAIALGMGEAAWVFPWQNVLFAPPDGPKNLGWLWLLLSFPGLIFALTGFQRAKQAQHWSWGRFLLCQGGGYSLLVILSPWSSLSLVMPLFAPLSLAAAASLTEACYPQRWVYPAWWRQIFLISGGLLLIIPTWVYWQGHLPWPDRLDQLWPLLLLASLALTLIMTATLLDQQKPEFIPVLFWGLFICLALAVGTPPWSDFCDWINQWPPMAPALTIAHHHLGP